MTRIVLFTAMDDARKRLKSNVQLVFTLTPDDHTLSPDSYPPIAWKILTFQQSREYHGPDPADDSFSVPEAKILSWGADFGFSVARQQEDGTITASDLCMAVDLEYTATLGMEHGIIDFVEPQKMTNTRAQAPVISVFNKTDVPQHLALCSVDQTNADYVTFYPVADLGQLRQQKAIECGLPVMLQAYAVSDYKEGQILKPGDLNRVLFIDPAGNPQHRDIRQITSGSLFRLYTKWNKFILEQAL